MEFLPEEIEAYIKAHTSPESNLLHQLNRETYQKVLVPRMLSGHIQGRVLSMLSHMIKPKCILEIGTYTGYSAICLAEGLQPGGRLITIDINEELEDMVNAYISEAKMIDCIDVKIGNAIEIIPTIKSTFDLVFIDADKTNYSNYFDLIIDQVSSGGYIIADNVLWSGKVVKEITENDVDTIAIRNYNQKIQTDSRVENVLFPIRDGLMVARKI
ncbi:MAG: O-methyltransferase [Crocinitomicaceae bacterium]|jgi:caffeoyl-CoA O-methyltransferase|nr:O-methyltransferase [Crocinitomicaceae bacterium]MBT5402277.1 O-methyltransferase [Crocinitomicaceae bacterium]MBT6030606.1 O-methyltransferase [Crocinitomicaceae bacterium]MBT6515153.1 O-methyltransferase [Crocinitomicaceae bacterium]